MGRSIDERMAQTLKFLCESEGLNPKTLKRVDGISPLFPKNSKEIEGLTDAISYVKTYAKIKAVSKLMVDEEGTKKDIVEAREHFEKLIEETKNEIAKLSKQPRKKKASLNYTFGDRFEEYAEKELEKAKAERLENLTRLKGNIAIYKEKIKKLNELDRTLANPRMIVKKLFADDMNTLNGEYGKLVNMCALSMTKEDFEHLLSDDEKNLFEFDGQDYSVNSQNARKFISVIKSKKAVLAIADYASKKNEYDSNRSEYTKCVNEQKKYAEIAKVAESKEFAKVTAMANEISEMFVELQDAEIKASKGSIFHRARNAVRRFFGIREKAVNFPRKLHYMKDELSDRMQDLLDYSNKSAETKRAYDAYMIVRKNVGKGNVLSSSDRLDWIIDSIRFTGTERTSWPTDTVSVEELKQNARDCEQKAAERAVDLEDAIMQNAAEKDGAFELLPKRAQKILETMTPEDVLKYATKYHGYNDKDKISEPSTGISPSAAALILEGIIRKRNLPYERIMEVYSDVAEKEKDKINLEEFMSQKVDSIRNGIAQMVAEYPRKDAEEKPLDLVPEKNDDMADREAM